MRTFNLIIVTCLAFGIFAGCAEEDDNCGSTSGCHVPPPETCGDSTCDALDGETVENCPADCSPKPEDCGDDWCAAGMENPMNCAEDCAGENICGNGECELAFGEDTFNCTPDCPAFTCGNGDCDGAETTTSCPADCR